MLIIVLYSHKAYPIADSGIYVSGFVGGHPHQLKQLTLPDSQKALQVSGLDILKNSSAEHLQITLRYAAACLYSL